MNTTTFHADNTIPTSDWIWVFGSNLKGRHGKGAAKVARVNFRAEYGVGCGRTGQSYAIPTKGERLDVLPLDGIKASAAQFIEYALANPKLKFFVTRVGCGLAGYQDDEIRPMFVDAPTNCSLPEVWRNGGVT